METAHFSTSSLADGYAIKGSFSEGQNILRTRSEGTYFKMERRIGEDKETFYQTAYQLTNSGVKSRTEQIDLVIGSGRKGQSYLYWRNGLLFQLSVSFLAARGEWANSPGYVDGEANFGQLITPRCLECHATSKIEGGASRNQIFARLRTWDLLLGDCHGDGGKHVEYHTGHPGENNWEIYLESSRVSERAKTRQLCVMPFRHA